MSQRDQNERVAALAREIADKFMADAAETAARIAALTVDDLPEIVTYQPPPAVVAYKPLSPAEAELGEHYGKMAATDPLAIIEEVLSGDYAKEIVNAPTLRKARAAGTSKAKEEFEVVVEIVAQVCAAKKIEPRNSRPCALRIKKHVDAEMLKRKLKPVGVDRLKRALGRVAAEQK